MAAGVLYQPQQHILLIFTIRQTCLVVFAIEVMQWRYSVSL